MTTQALNSASVTLGQISAGLAKFELSSAGLRHLSQVVKTEADLETVRQSLQEQMDEALQKDLKALLMQWERTSDNSWKLLALAQGFMGKDDLHPCFLPAVEAIERSPDSFRPVLLQMLKTASRGHGFVASFSASGALRARLGSLNEYDGDFIPSRDRRGLDFWLRTFHKLIDERIAGEESFPEFGFPDEVGPLIIFASKLAAEIERAARS
jgi:hypothetical protein